MAIDPSISLGVRPIQLDNPVESYGKALGLKALMLHNQSSEQAYSDNQRLRGIYADPSAQDPASLRDLLYKSGVPGGVTAGVALNKDVIANESEQLKARKAQLDNVTQQHAIASSVFGALGQNPTLDQVGQAFQYLQSKGLQPDISDAPKTQEEVQPWLQKVMARGQTVGEQIKQANEKWDQQFKTTGLANTERHQGVMEKQGAEGLRLRKLEVDPFGTLANAATNSVGGGKSTAPGQPGTEQTIGTDYLSTIPKPLADQVKALAEGRLAFPAGFALKSPYWQNMLQMVSQYDPSFDAVNFNARAAMRKDATSGTMAKSATAINTAIGHLDTLSKAADSLNNTNFGAYNSVANWVASNTGDPRVKVFENTRKAVVDELTRVWRGTGGSEGDIKSWEATLGAAGSPAQLHAVIKNIGELMESRLHALEDQYGKGMGTTENGLQLVSPKNAELLNRLQQKAAQPAAGKPSKGGVQTKPAPGASDTNPQPLAGPTGTQPAARGDDQIMTDYKAGKIDQTEFLKRQTEYFIAHPEEIPK